MNEAILTINAGSSSIKFAVFPLVDPLSKTPEIRGEIEGIDPGGKQLGRIKIIDRTGRLVEDSEIGLPGVTGSGHLAALAFLIDWLHSHASSWRISVAGHRVVHGGNRYSSPVLINADTMQTLHALVPLAPLHQPHNLAGIEAMQSCLPDMPQVACFDTAFHTTQPAVARAFGLPRSISVSGVHRYGFHGLSYEYIAGMLPEHLGDVADDRVVVAHLGNGASMCGMHKRRSIVTTMGFTPLDGLIMGTRSGSIDPGVLLYLMQEHGMDAAALSDLLYKESGLLGVSGISSDMRTLLASDKAEAREAVELFSYRAVRELGSLAAALGGIDALVFTGGIGEHAAQVRALICASLGWLGVSIDSARNIGNSGVISTSESRLPVLVLPTNEEWMIAWHAAALVQAKQP